MQPSAPSSYQGTPTPYMPQAPLSPTRRINWLAIFGGIVAFIGALLWGITNFAFSTLPSDATFDSYRWTYQLAGAGDVAFGIGLLMAFAGLALSRHGQ